MLVTWSKGHVWEPLLQSQHLVYCGVDTSYVGGDMYFICHMTQQDHSIEMSCVFMGERWHVFQVLHRFKPCSQYVRDSLTLVLAANKAKHFLSANHTPKTIHHHHQSSSQHVTTLKSLVTIGILIVKSQNTSSKTWMLYTEKFS